MSDKRYQVFVSSTYKDLKDEREEIARTLMTMGCIPAGMEFFTAMDEDTFEFIKTVIDLSDYFLLIIANRYGSPAPDGLSYTEKEYDYAISKGLKVVALIHEKPESLPFDLSEETAVARKKLEAFREKVKGEGKRIVKLWTKPEELPGHVALSVQAVINRYPATGWVRGDQVASKELLTRVDDLYRVNSSLSRDVFALQERIEELESAPLVEDLAGLDERFTLRVTGENYARSMSWEVSPTWRDIFAWIAPYLLQPKNDAHVTVWLLQAIYPQIPQAMPKLLLDVQALQTIKIQFVALNLIADPSSVRENWVLTPHGKKLLWQVRAVKSGSTDTGLPRGADPDLEAAE